MRRSRLLSAVWWLIAGVASGVVLIATWAGVMKGRLIDDQELARRQAEEADATKTVARELESTCYQVIKLMHDQELARREVERANAAMALAREIESAVKTVAKDRGSTYAEIASQHSDAVELLDSLLHSGGEFNGRITYVLFTDDYYRDPEKCRSRWQSLRDWHARLAEKYRHAARHPSEPVPPDPPEPR